MISVSAALDLVLRDLPCLGAERVALLQACGRVMAETVHATRDVPPFRNSAMDGYAVRADDIGSAERHKPVTLRVLELVGAGAVPQHRVSPGSATKIMTGSPLPDGADCVVRVEDTEFTETEVRVQAAVQRGANVREAGEDMHRGDIVLAAGDQLNAADIGVLASLGIATVLVRRRPIVGILATGDELVELGQPLQPGKIANSNAYMLAAAVEEAGGVARMLGIVADRIESARALFAEALRCDVVLSTGGVSMGTFDLVRATLADLGVTEKFWKVAQKPGKPLSFGRREHTLVFGLPGNPVSALVCFYVYVRPALRAMMQFPTLHLPVVHATLADELKASSGLTDFVRCVLTGAPHAYRARVTGSQSSGVLRSMAIGNGLIIAGPDTAKLAAGASVRVMRIGADDALERPETEA